MSASAAKAYLVLESATPPTMAKLPKLPPNFINIVTGALGAVGGLGVLGYTGMNSLYNGEVDIVFNSLGQKSSLYFVSYLANMCYNRTQIPQ